MKARISIASDFSNREKQEKELNTLEELISFMEKIDENIILGYDKEEGFNITIYDYYVE